MAFLDNSGDIILDAVLTDAGRKRMAEGKFNIAKYAFGDEEINYELFNNNHPSGSAFYDLQLMQTPILEAFTNNTSTMSSKLMTLNDNNFLYLPTLKLNEVWGEPLSGIANDHNLKKSMPAGGTQHSGSFLVTVDSSTEELYKFRNAEGVVSLTNNIRMYNQGVMLGASPTHGLNNTFICIDQGIGGTQQGLSVASDFPDELRETAYMIRIDNRLGRIQENLTAPYRAGGFSGNSPSAIPNNEADQGLHKTERLDGTVVDLNVQSVANAEQSYAFVDDDNMATYYITTQQTRMLIPDIKTTFNGDDPLSADIPTGTTRLDQRWRDRQVFKDGPVGSRLMFSIKAQPTVATSFDLFGTNTKTITRALADDGNNGTPLVADVDGNPAHITVRYIDTIVSVTGVTTGYRIDIPVRFVKRTTS